MGWEAYSTIIALCVVGAMSPGPSLAVVLRSALSGGLSKGLGTAVLHGVGVGGWALLVVTGLSSLLEQAPALRWGLEIGGVLLLLWMSYQSWPRDADAAEGEPREPQGSVWAGLWIVVLNPKLAVFFLAIFGPQVGELATWGERLRLVGIAWFIDTVWYCLVVTVAAQTAVVEKMQRQQWLPRVLSGALLFAAFEVAWGWR